MGSNYAHDADSGKGTKTARYTPTITDAGDYEVYVLWTGRSYNAPSVPVTVTHVGGNDTTLIDQTVENGEWFSLGTYAFDAGTDGNVLNLTVNQQSYGGTRNRLGSYYFEAGTGGSVTISNANTTGYVIADSVRFELN